MTETEAKLLALTRGPPISEFTEDGPKRKDAFHKLGRKVLEELVQALGLPKGTTAIRSNRGGPAVSGEVVLHAERLYVRLLPDAPGILYRLCNGRTDYGGGANCWLPWEKLDQLAVATRKLLEEDRWDTP